MEAVTMYRAEDGKMFDDMATCRDHEDDLKMARHIIDRICGDMRPGPDEFTQHPEGTKEAILVEYKAHPREAVRKELWAIWLAMNTSEQEFFRGNTEPNLHPKWARCSLVITRG